METTLVLWKAEIFKDFVKSKFRKKVLVPEISRINPVLENIRTEAGADFIQYLHFLQLAKEPNLMALSSTHHYYYDFNDLKSIKTLINLKKLNNIKSLGSFLHTVGRILPQKANFIGYFKNDTGNRSVFSFYQSTKIYNSLINYFDSRTDRSLTKKEVSRLLEEHRLKVVDISDINGMTYFCSQNNR
ncbi:MAG: hypothetical protein H6Q23_72 [Bacteroidetes bacterium]|nr:hypothetical protein [Bacteroidota bacterium]